MHEGERGVKAGREGGVKTEKQSSFFQCISLFFSPFSFIFSLILLGQILTIASELYTGTAPASKRIESDA